MPDSVGHNVACRICMDSKDNCVSLFSHDLSKKFTEVADIQVEKDDGLPETICMECESDLEKCYEFRLKVQVADKKFRENIKFSQVDIVEYNIKQEGYAGDETSENGDDRDSLSMDDDEPDVAQKNQEENDEIEPYPMNHVAVIEQREGKTKMSEDLLNRDQAMIDEPEVGKFEEPALDALTCMKEEAEAEIMDIDNNQLDPFGTSSSVRNAELPNTLPSLSSALASGVANFTNEFEMGKEQQPLAFSKLAEALQCSKVGKKEKPSLQALQDGTPQGRSRERSSHPSVGSKLSLNPYTTTMKSQTDNSQGNISVINSPLNKINSVQSGCENNLVIRLDNKSAASCSVRNLRNENIFKTQFVSSETSDPTSSHKADLPSHKDKQIHITEVEVSIGANIKSANVETLESRLLSEDDEYFCHVCNIDFGFPDLLKEHKNGNEFICRVCTTILNTHQELESHFYQHRKFSCEFCKKAFYVKADLFDHKKKSSMCNKRPKKLKCEICHNRFVHEMNLQTHMEFKHPDAYSRSFTCDICNSSFISSGGFRAHMKSIHTAYENMECDICHKILCGPQSLKTHVKNKHLQCTESCPICHKEYSSKTALNNHLESHLGEERVCDICGAVVKGRVAFKHHLYYHESRTYSCTQCNVTLNSLSEKNRHYRKNHKHTPKPAICEICGKAYKTKEILKHHMVTHSDVKPFVCDICGAAFKTKTVLKTHNRVHNDLRKYSCEHCGESFRWKQTFDKHILRCESSHNDVMRGGTD